MLMHDRHQDGQNIHNTATSVRETPGPAVEISGITGYRLVGLLLAIAGLVNTALSAPVKKMNLVITGVFGIMYVHTTMDPYIEFNY